MNKSIAKNSLFYFIYTFLNMLFPFISSMYVAHILTPSSIGDVAIAQNIVSYFSILAFLGIPTYGLREIAKYRNNKEELNKIYSELIIINTISTLIFSFLYYGMILIFPRFYKFSFLYFIVGITVILNMFNIGWLYEGLEEFGFISKRNAVFKVFMFILLILWVKKESDILIYASINVIGVAGNNLINVLHSKKYVCFTFKNLNIKRHLKSIFFLVIVNLAIEIYTLVDTTMLGMMTSNEHVAFYTYGSRVNRMLLQITNTITMVLVPRISFEYKEKNYDEFNRLLTRGLKVIIIFAIPIIIGIQFCAQFIFIKLYGTMYISSAYVEQILCFVLLISPIGYLLGSRVMLVSSNEKKMVLCVGAGAITNIIGNVFLIPLFNEYGAAIASVISELVVMLFYVYNGKKVYKLKKYSDTVCKTMIAGIVAGVYLFILNHMEKSWTKFVLQVCGTAVLYCMTLIILKEEFVKHYLLIIKGKIKLKKD